MQLPGEVLPQFGLGAKLHRPTIGLHVATGDVRKEDQRKGTFHLGLGDVPRQDRRIAQPKRDHDSQQSHHHRSDGRSDQTEARRMPPERAEEARPLQHQVGEQEAVEVEEDRCLAVDPGDAGFHPLHQLQEHIDRESRTRFLGIHLSILPPRCRVPQAHPGNWARPPFAAGH